MILHIKKTRLIHIGIFLYLATISHMENASPQAKFTVSTVQPNPNLGAQIKIQTTESIVQLESKQADPKMQSHENSKIPIPISPQQINLTKKQTPPPSPSTSLPPHLSSQKSPPQDNTKHHLTQEQKEKLQLIGQDKQFINSLDHLRDTIIRKQQKQLVDQQLKQQQQSLYPWNAQQLNLLSLDNYIQTHQIFLFAINTDQQLQFKWNPSQKKQPALKFVVQIYDISQDDLLLPDNPEQQDFVQVFVHPDHMQRMISLGKVYIKRMFLIQQFTDYTIIKLKNHYSQKMYIQISLQATKFIPQTALDDDDLKIPAQKIQSILQQLQQTQIKRQKTFKEQWSFKDRQENHQSEMLILTGIQLMVIIGTAIIQMYCIKNLFDNRLIV